MNMNRVRVAFWTVACCFGVSAADVIWTGAGADQRWATADNWDGKVVPGANDTAVIESKTVEATQADQAVLAALGGIRVASGATLRLKTSAATDTLEMTKPISGDGALELVNNGVMRLRADNTYTGGTKVSGANSTSSKPYHCVYVHAAEAFGKGGVTVLSDRGAVSLFFEGNLTIENNFTFNADGKSPGQFVPDQGTFVFNGKITVLGSMFRFRAYTKGTTVTFRGGVETTPQFCLNATAGATNVFDSVLTMNGGFIYGDGAGTTVFKQPAKALGTVQIYNGVWRFETEKAWPSTCNVQWYKSDNNNYTACVDLNGYSQEWGNSYHQGNVTDWNRIYTLTSDTPASLTVNGTQDSAFYGKIDGAASLVWNAASGHRLTVSNSVSTTTGSLTARAGTLRLVNSSFASVSALVVEEGACLALAGSVQLNDTLALTVAPGGEFAFDDGKFVVASLTCGGTSRGPGRYTGTGGPVDAIVLDGLVGTGVITVNKERADTLARATWTGASATTSATDAGNWSSEPALESGAFIPVFADAGTVASFADASLWWTGIVFTAQAPLFTLKAEPTARLTLSGTVSLPASEANAAPYVYTNELPVCVDGPLFVDVAPTNGTGDAEFTAARATQFHQVGPLDSPAAMLCTKTGTGAWHLWADSTFTGTFRLEKGPVHVHRPGALGREDNTIEIVLSSGKTDDRDALFLYGGTWPYAISADGTDGRMVVCPAGTTNLFTRKITLTGIQKRFAVEKNTRTVFSGGLTSNHYFIPQGRSNNPNDHVVVMTNTPFALAALYADTPVHLQIFTSGNTLTGINGNGVHCTGGAWIEVFADDVFTGGKPLRLQGSKADVTSRLDLHGHDVTVGRLAGTADETYPSVVRSETPACLSVTQDAAFSASVSFTEAASLLKDGTERLTLTAPSSTTGSLAVVKGELCLTQTATWTNALDVVVSSTDTQAPAKLMLSSNRLLGRMATVSLGGTGCLDLAYPAGTRQRVAYLYCDGEKKATGTYGATGSGARYVLDGHFTGTGMLEVCGGTDGFSLILR